MPHYGNGIEAKVGDQVIGHLYNTPGIVAGVITSITPGSEACNAMVRYTVAGPSTVGPTGEGVPRMALRPLQTDIVRTEAHHTEGPEVTLYVCEDYSAINELTKVG